MGLRRGIPCKPKVLNGKETRPFRHEIATFLQTNAAAGLFSFAGKTRKLPQYWRQFGPRAVRPDGTSCPTAMVAGGGVRQGVADGATGPDLPSDRHWRPPLAWGKAALRWTSVVGALSWPMLAAGQSAAERRAGLETVENRVRPGTEAMGLAAGSLRILPSITFGAIATDNLYARRDTRVSDIGATLAPALAMQSQWDRHALTINLDGQFDRYARHGAEGSDRFDFGASGRIDAAKSTRFTLSADYARRIEARGTTGDTLFAVKPIAYRQLTLASGAEQDLGQTRLAFDLRYDRYHYLDRHTPDGTIFLAQRDYQTFSATAKATQPISPALGLFLSGSLNSARYPHEDPTQDTRRSHGYSVMTGIAFGRQHLLEGQVALGYLRQAFDSPHYPTIAGLAYAAALRWNLTTLTTITLDANKTLQRSPIIDVAGIEQQAFSLGAAHELLRTVILRPKVSYTINRFRGGDRVDHYASADLGATWRPARHLAVDIDLRHALGRSTAEAAKPREYDQNRATLSLRYMF